MRVLAIACALLLGAVCSAADTVIAFDQLSVDVLEDAVPRSGRLVEVGFTANSEVRALAAIGDASGTLEVLIERTRYAAGERGVIRLWVPFGQLQGRQVRSVTLEAVGADGRREVCTLKVLVSLIERVVVSAREDETDRRVAAFDVRVGQGFGTLLRVECTDPLVMDTTVTPGCDLDWTVRLHLRQPADAGTSTTVVLVFDTPFYRLRRMAVPVNLAPR